jgi:hypothetical protein
MSRMPKTRNTNRTSTGEEREALAHQHYAEWRGQPDAAVLTENLVRDFVPEQGEAAAIERY